MPTSPSRRAPSSAASIAWSTSSPSSARAETTTPSRNSSVMPDTFTPRGEDGTPNRTTPEAEVSTGPVNTSPDGMFRRPSELIHRRPETESVRSVPSPSMRSSEQGDNRSTSRACDADSSPHAPAGSERSRNSARSTNAPSSSKDIPASRAIAGVGHSDTHHRRASAGLTQRRPPAGGTGEQRRIDVRESPSVMRRMDRHRCVGLLGLHELHRREPVEVHIPSRRPERLLLARQRRPGATATPLVRAPRVGGR